MTADAREWIAAVAERAQAATNGPWEVGLGQDVELYGNNGRQWVARTGERGVRGALEDAVFVASARSDLPTAVGALTAVLDLHQEGNEQDATEGDCTTCRDTYGDRIAYPCPTVTALTTALEGA